MCRMMNILFRTHHGVNVCFFIDKQMADLRRAWETDFISVEQLDNALEALDQIKEGRINYNQFIYKTEVEGLKLYLLM